jgi:hypothetical protein
MIDPALVAAAVAEAQLMAAVHGARWHQNRQAWDALRRR